MALATLQHTHARLNGFQESKQCSIYHKRNWHNKCRNKRDVNYLNTTSFLGHHQNGFMVTGTLEHTQVQLHIVYI